VHDALQSEVRVQFEVVDHLLAVLDRSDEHVAQQRREPVQEDHGGVVVIGDVMRGIRVPRQYLADEAGTPDEVEVRSFVQVRALIGRHSHDTAQPGSRVATQPMARAFDIAAISQRRLPRSRRASR
jgi:hypothetical protein